MPISLLYCRFSREQIGGAQFNERNLGTYTVRWECEVDKSSGIYGPQSVAVEALTTGPNMLPSLWTSYSYQGDADSTSFARDYNVRQRSAGNVYLWDIDVTYRPLGPSEPSGFSNTNPLSRPTVYWWDTETFTRVIGFDKDGNEIANKVGITYDEPLEQEETRGVLVAEWNVASLATVINLNRIYENSVNQTSWQGISPRAALCRQMRSGPLMTEAGTTFYRMIAKFAIKENGETWDRGILEQGYNAFMKDDQGQYVLENDATVPTRKRRKLLSDRFSEPRKLDEDGTLLPDDTPGIFTFWRTRKETNFNSIPFV